ncbi:CHAP domain-containing protein [Nonomuraea sp. NBC_01738]|nr:CHAP domain-containing protein [Nonomuraea sp. NBC_01738]
MDPIAQELLEKARPEVGYREKGGQHTKFGEWYADRLQDPQYRNAPWCDMFIAWAADKAGVSEYVGQFAWTPSHAAWFIKQGAWSRVPEPGALVFFDWGGGKSYQGIDHVGIVERVEGTKIRTIEANVDKVWLKRKFRDTDKVVGYGLPRVVKEKSPLQGDIRATTQPFAVSPQLNTAVEQPGRSTPLDILGTPQALLAGMVLTTVIVSFRLAGRRRGSHRRGLRALIPWNAPSTPVTIARPSPRADRPAVKDTLDDRLDAFFGAGGKARQKPRDQRTPLRAEAPDKRTARRAEAPAERVPVRAHAGAPPAERRPVRRKPYEKTPAR